MAQTFILAVWGNCSSQRYSVHKMKMIMTFVSPSIITLMDHWQWGYGGIMIAHIVIVGTVISGIVWIIGIVHEWYLYQLL